MTERLVSDPYAIAFVNAMCDCKACVELAESGGCAVCGHRDHGRSGCRAYEESRP